MSVDDAEEPAAAHARQAKRYSLPLTSFEDTPQNAVAIACVLGVVFSWFGRNALGFLAALSPSSSTSGSLGQALASPLLGAYIASWAVFHLAEYLVTAICNPAKANVDSFLLNNGNEYHIAHLFGIAEFVLEDAFLPESLRRYKHTALAALGLAIVVAAQVLRTTAMATAAANFTHAVAFRKTATHTLVTTGVYAHARHPSYLAFFWWAVGTQLMLGNPIATVGFALVTWRFFKRRIQAEEKALVVFFGDDYHAYRQRVPTRIPGIP